MEPRHSLYRYFPSIPVFIPEPSSKSAAGEPEVQHNTGTKYKKVLGHRAVQLMSAYILVYVGVEVTIG